MKSNEVRSTRADIFANYSAAILQAVIPLLAIPILARYLDADVMALVLLYATFALLLLILDAGLSATSLRQIAEFRGGAVDAETAIGRVNAIQATYGILVLILLAVTTFAASVLATNWFAPTSVSPETLTWYLRLVFVGLAARFMSGLYANVLIGFDMVRFVSRFTVAFTLLRYGSACLIAILIPESGAVVLVVISASYVLEAVGIGAKAQLQLRRIASGITFRPSFSKLREVLPFAVSVFTSTAIWLALSQTDRIVLSGQMSLSGYGEYAILLMVASGVSLLGTPIGAIVQPRLTRYIAAGDEASAQELFCRTSALVAALAAGAAAWLYVVGTELLTIYLGEAPTLPQSATILTLYAVGNAALALSTFSYYLQYSIGDLSLHLRIGVVQVAVVVPATVYAAVVWGPVGCATVWAISNLVILVTWVPFVLYRLRRNWAISWLQSVATPVALVLGVCIVGNSIVSKQTGGGLLVDVAMIAFVGTALLVVGSVPIWLPTARRTFRDRKRGSIDR